MNSARSASVDGEVTLDQCLGLVATETFGHLALIGEGDPMVLLVTVTVADKALVVLLADPMPRAAASQRPVSLMVDHVDPVTKEGWSVVANGGSPTISPTRWRRCS